MAPEGHAWLAALYCRTEYTGKVRVPGIGHAHILRSWRGNSRQADELRTQLRSRVQPGRHVKALDSMHSTLLGGTIQQAEISELCLQKVYLSTEAQSSTGFVFREPVRLLTIILPLWSEEKD